MGSIGGLAVLLAFASGSALAIQGPTNSALARGIGNIQASVFSFATALAALLIATALFGQGDLTRISQASLWQLFGGVYGAFMVLVATYAVPVLGAGLALAATMLGNVALGLAIDTFGWFGCQQVAPGWMRTAGALVIAVAITLVFLDRSRDSREHDKNVGVTALRADTSKRLGLMLALSVIAGMAGAAQSPTNASLAQHVGAIEAADVSFAGGLAIMVAFAAIGKARPRRLSGTRLWTWAGGIYGAIAVTCALVSTSMAGVSITVTSSALGQLLGGFAIDSFGLFGCPKVRSSRLRIAGIVALTVGTALVALSRMV